MRRIEQVKEYGNENLLRVRALGFGDAKTQFDGNVCQRDGMTIMHTLL